MRPKDHAQHLPQLPSAAQTLQIIDNLKLGGAQRLLVTLAESLPEGDTLRVLALTSRDGPFGAILESAGARVIRFGDLRLWNPLSLLRLAHHLRNDPARTVHLHLTYATILGAPAARFAGKRVVVSLHNSDTVVASGLRNRILLWMETFCLRHFTDHVIFVGANVERANQARLGSVAGTTISNVIPLPRPLSPSDRDEIRSANGATPDDVVVISAGRLSPQKNPIALIRAFAAAQARLPSLRLWIAGDGILRAEAEALVATLPSRDRIHFLGARDDVAQLLPAADIFALTSLWEGLPVVLLEAMAAGLPVVSTNVGDIAQVITPQDAVLLPAGDDPAFADALARLAVHPDQRKALSNRALAASRPHTDVDGWRARLERVYAENDA